MADATKKTGGILLPVAVAGAVVVGIIVVVFGFSGETPPDEPTVIAEDDVNGEPAGAGTMAEGEADATEDGITAQVDEVDPAAPGVDQVPAAEETEADADTLTQNGDVDDVVSPAGEATTTEASEAGGADGEQPVSAEAQEQPPMQAPEEGYLYDEESYNAEAPTDQGGDVAGAPAGRDADTNLTPEEGQDVVRDTDNGGAAVVPTPSGPEGRDDTTAVGN